MRTILAAVLSMAFVVSVVQAERGGRRGGGQSRQEYEICHIPPGNPDNAHTITVRGWLAVLFHLLHGDTMGPCPEPEGRTALLFVGHGEPSNPMDGDIPIVFPDGEPFGPHAASLGVPESAQYTEWAAAYEEIATAMTYIFGDVNGNGVLHEVAIYPDGDVPDFFVWPAFHGTVYQQYQACDNYSPHNDSLREHVESLDIEVCGEEVDVFLAYLDAVPRIRDVLWEIDQFGGYDELVVIPMLLADSTHTQEVHDLVEDSAHLTEGMDVIVTEPFFEVPFVQRRFRDAALGMAQHLRAAMPTDVPDFNIGVLLASHGTPYVPPFPEFGYTEGDIFSNLIPTEDAFHEEIGERLPWMSRTGRMNYSSPTIGDALEAFEADGFTHIMVVPSAFPTAAIHTMWDVAREAVDRPVLPWEGVVQHTRDSGMTVYYTSQGLADVEPGRTAFREGLHFMGVTGAMEAVTEVGEDDFTPYQPCEAGYICVTVAADQLTGGELQYMLYETTEADWPQAFGDLPTPDWVVADPGPIPDHFPARVRIPLDQNLIPVGGQTLEGAQFGLAIASADGTVIEPTDARGFSTMTAVYEGGAGMNFGKVNVTVPGAGGPCLAGEICVTISAEETTGPDLKLMLFETTEDGWPQEFLNLPTPDWVVTETVPVPGTFPIHIRIPLEGNVFAVGGQEVEGARVGLAVVTGVASIFIVEPDDARGFSDATLVYQTGVAMNFGEIELTVPEGDVCDLNPYDPNCLTGSLLWQEHYIGEEGFVPGAIYMDVADLDGDGISDIVMVGEPHFEWPEMPLSELKLGVYYLNADFTLKGTEIIDQWSETDQLFYSPWGVNVIDHGGEPMIIVGTNIPGLAPLEDGTGAVLSYRREAGDWVRDVVMENPDPTVTNYNAMIVVTSDIDNDGDEDLVLSTAFENSSAGSWMENTGLVGDPWVPHLVSMPAGTYPDIRGVLGYKSVDLNGDGYPEVVYNGMFDVPNSNPPQYRGEIWLGVNPGAGGWGDPWQLVVIDDTNWASADMWFHDFDGDGNLDLVANQIFNGTVTVYRHPGGNLADPWLQEIIIDDLVSPSDMWLADMDNDGLMDVVSADHTAHRGVWHKNPGTIDETWQMNLIYRDIRLPGDFVMIDMDEDGDLDWVGTSLTLGQAFIVEQIQPETSLVTTISLPDGFSGTPTTLMVTLAESLPVTGPPAAVLATISNADADGDGTGDVEEILNPDRDLVLALPDVGVVDDYHVVVVLFMEGGGQFQPVSGVDYMAASGLLSLGAGQVAVELELMLVP